jgi:preprotein translocase subunit SecD
MSPGRIRRSGLVPLIFMVAATFGALVGALASGWGPKLGLDLEGGFSVTLQPVDEASDDTLDQAIEIIRTRVDALGVAEPEILRQGSTIVVSLPGVTDRDQARELVGQTAELRFRPVLFGIDGDLSDLELEPTTTTTAPGDGSTTTTAPADGAATSTTVAGEVEGQGRGAAPFQDDPTTTAPADTTTTTAAGDTTTTTAPAAGEPGLEVTAREDDDPTQTVVLQEVDGDTVVRTYQLGPSQATGEIVSDAGAELDLNGQWTVRLEITAAGIDQFNQVAAQCFARGETCPTGQLAIVLDSQVVSAPNISEPSYARDQIVISGSFDESEAKNLALVLRYGSLPVALETQQTQEISATLGSDSLRAAIIAGLVGLALVFVYMVAYYRLLGLVAMLSLALSGALLWTVVAWLGETQGLALTLAGITGIIVSIGIAVDSNVVFYEHLKETVSRGRSVRSAVSGSFASAFSTIVKADVASLIGAGVLYFLTVGPVRGFALFLGLSTILDIIASYFFMRPLVVRLARSPRVQERPGLLGLPDPKAVAS